MKKIVLSGLVASAIISSVNAQEFYVAPTIGKVIHESGELEKDSIFGFRVGMPLETKIGTDTVEFAYDRQNSVDYNRLDESTAINRLSGNVLKHYNHLGAFVPYALVGLGFEHIKNDKQGIDNSLFANVGAGLKYKLANNMALMTDIRHIVRFDEFDNHTVWNVGLVIPFGAPAKVEPKPVEMKKVEIKKVEEPKPVEIKKVEEPKPVMPVDSDKDGVVDGLDKCPTSPNGAKVDANGCCLDGDKDGVVDGLDKCPTSHAGAKVDANGCCLDSDNDGVKDFADICPTSPAGAKVDSKGCTIIDDKDSDKDGVLDSADKCPATPVGFAVDKNGCEISTNLKIYFDTNKANIKEQYENDIAKFVLFMKAFPSYKAEIGGHTDSRGEASKNKALSQKRADSLKAKIIEDGISANRLSAVGYGEDKPDATNDTKEGQDLNRRLEVNLSK